MALNQLGLGFVFTAKDEATGVIRRINESFGELDRQTEQVSHAAKGGLAEFGKGLAVFAAGSTIVGGAFELAEIGDRFTLALEQAGALANAGAEGMERLREAALGAALRGTGTSAAEAAEGLRELVQEGFDAADAAKALGPTLTLVSLGMGQISRAQAAGLVNDTLGEFRLGVEQAGALVDKLALSMRTFGLRATELEPALRGVATGASLTGASLDDTLIALGLTKTVLPSVEQAARSVNLAFSQLASSHTRQELAKIGIQVADSAGKMRPLIELLSDLNARTARMTEAQREHALASIFSARAGGGLTAIMQALGGGIRTASGQVVTGASAIEELRRQLATAGGVAEGVKARLRDTFEGQKKGLIGAASTFLQLLGEPLAEAFKPILAAVRRVFVAVNQLVAAIPESMKRLIAKVVIGVGAFTMLLGTVLAAKSAIALIGLGLQILGVTLGGLVASLLPVIAVVALLGLAFQGLSMAFEKNLGGIRTFLDETWSRVKLLFQGLAQLFEEGGFSGAVMKDLEKAENGGVKQFAIRVYQMVFRLQRLFEGVAEGFGAAIDRARPIIELVGAAIRSLVEELSGLVRSIFGMNGQAIESSAVWRAIGEVLGGVAGTLGTVLAGAIGGVALALRMVISIVRGVIEAFAALGQFIGETAAKIYLFFTETIPRVFKMVTSAAKAFFQPIVDFLTGVVDGVLDVIDRIIASVGRLAAKLPAGFRPVFLDEVVEAGGAAQARLVARESRIGFSTQASLGASGAMPAVDEVRARGEISDAELDALVRRGVALSDARPVQAHVTLNVDGETLARASARAERSVAARSFIPVSVPG